MPVFSGSTCVSRALQLVMYLLPYARIVTGNGDLVTDRELCAASYQRPPPKQETAAAVSTEYSTATFELCINSMNTATFHNPGDLHQSNKGSRLVMGPDDSIATL